LSRSIRIFVGYDAREAVAYHVCCQSILEKASIPVAFLPLTTPDQRGGSNAFTFSRYQIPFLCDFSGWALFIDGDMVIDEDIAKLWEYTSVYYNKAVAVVKHDYQTRHARKYVGSAMESKNEDYPRKNWSSVVLWNCAHFSNRVLMPEYLQDAPAAYLHRFQWLEDKDIGELPMDWNYLMGEYPPHSPSLYHHTLGIPALRHYSQDYGSWKWHGALVRALQCAGETPSQYVKRAEEAVGEGT
jgi:lipopolysaccharide biosynthesis glycosyltransferase